MGSNICRLCSARSQLNWAKDCFHSLPVIPPLSKWNQTTGEVLSVIQALMEEQEYSIDDIAIYGDSAAGGLAAGSVFKICIKGTRIPAALVLCSPWIDVTRKGDTYVTMENADPITSANLTLKTLLKSIRIAMPIIMTNIQIMLLLLLTAWKTT